MSKIKVDIDGIDKLEKALRENVTLQDVKKVVRYHGASLQRGMQEKADFKKGYQTGTTKRSIGLEISDSGMTADIGPETEYSPYLEYGTRFMEAQPFINPPYEEEKRKFKSDMQKLAR